MHFSEPLLQVNRVAKTSAALAFTLACGQAVADTTIYNSNGFELTPPYSNGNLVGQDGYMQFHTGTPGTAVVQSVTAYEGSKSVKLTNASGSESHFFRLESQTLNTSAANRFLKIDWRLKCDVPQATNYGPFFGIDVYSSPGNRLATFGIDAKTGDGLYLDAANVVNTTEKVYTPTEWNLFNITLDYSAKKAYFFVNGIAQIPAGINFDMMPILNTFTHADFIGIPADGSEVTATGSAYFDNVVIYSSAIPEPGSGVLIAAVLLGVVRRRRSTV